VHSDTAFATPRYSASALERDTVVWRFEDHETNEPPRKTAKPDVERRVPGQPAQSASVYAVIVGEDDARSWRPSDEVPLM